MKLLALNCKPDLSYYAQHGVKIDVTYDTVNQKFPLKFLYTGKDQQGLPFDLYTPDVSAYLEAKYKLFEYSVIMVGWNPDDYGDNVKRTGGYTCPQQLSSGTFWCTVRQDNPVNNSYPVHELMHCLCMIINIIFGEHTPKDFMDSTPVNGYWLPYYINDPNSTDSQSNYNQTWIGINPFIEKLNNISYPKADVVITRQPSTLKQTLGILRTTDGQFGCYSLENLPVQIPKGIYQVKWTFSWKFMRYTYEIQNVVPRSGIRFHAGSYFFNSEGCILLGSLPQDINHDGELDLQNSRLITKAFENKFNKQPFILMII